MHLNDAYASTCAHPLATSLHNIVVERRLIRIFLSISTQPTRQKTRSRTDVVHTRKHNTSSAKWRLQRENVIYSLYQLLLLIAAALWGTRITEDSTKSDIKIKTTIRELIVYIVFLILLLISKQLYKKNYWAFASAFCPYQTTPTQRLPLLQKSVRLLGNQCRNSDKPRKWYFNNNLESRSFISFL